MPNSKKTNCFQSWITPRLERKGERGRASPLRWYVCTSAVFRYHCCRSLSLSPCGYFILWIQAWGLTLMCIEFYPTRLILLLKPLRNFPNPPMSRDLLFPNFTITNKPMMVFYCSIENDDAKNVEHSQSYSGSWAFCSYVLYIFTPAESRLPFCILSWHMAIHI